MAGPKGNSEFCFPLTLNISQSKAKGDIEGQGKTKLTVSCGTSHEVFCYIPPNSKIEQITTTNYLLDATSTQICRGFKVHDLIMCESKIQVVVSLGSW